jgi:hypothetical protein
VDGRVRRGEPDEVSFGRAGPPRFRPPGWLIDRRVAAGVVVVVVVVVAAVAARGHGQRPSRRAGPVTMIDVGHRLLGVRAGWDLFAAGPGVLVRIGFAAGVITRTAVPELMSTGPVSFVVGPRQAVIRPLDLVPGYLVPDGRPARPLRAALSRGGPAYPGPRAGLLWVQTGLGPREVMSLVTYAGRRAGGNVTIAGSLAYLAIPDGRGYLLVQEGGAVYDIRPGRRWRVASGTLAAAGPSAWLVTRCSHGRCRYQVVDPASGARRLVSGRVAPPGVATPPGVISPDGVVAAVVRYRPGHRPLLHLINLATGADRILPISISESAGPADGTSALAWSPDSRWLFAVTADGSLIAINPGTGQASALGVALPPVAQLAIRAAR